MNQKGVVSEVFPRFCNVILDTESDKSDPKKLLCTYRRAQILVRDPEWLERSPVAPGDIVQVQVLGSKDGVIEELLPRRNAIQRKAPGKEGKVLHTIATNIDFVVVVTSLHDPDFSPGLVDRFLIAAQKAQIIPLIVINKTDLKKTAEDRPWKLYEDLGFQCFPISTHKNEGIGRLEAVLSGKTAVFCGHSGVGKTSLLRTLFGEVFGKIGDVNKVTRKGKHTTTVSTLLQAKNRTRFIDTPGIIEFGLFKIDPKELIEFFPEIHELQLKREPFQGLPRYDSYMRIKAALEDEGR